MSEATERDDVADFRRDTFAKYADRCMSFGHGARETAVAVVERAHGDPERCRDLFAFLRAVASEGAGLLGDIQATPAHDAPVGLTHVVCGSRRATAGMLCCADNAIECPSCGAKVGEACR